MHRGRCLLGANTSLRARAADRKPPFLGPSVHPLTRRAFPQVSLWVNRPKTRGRNQRPETANSGRLWAASHSSAAGYLKDSLNSHGFENAAVQRATGPLEDWRPPMMAA